MSERVICTCDWPTDDPCPRHCDDKRRAVRLMSAADSMRPFDMPASATLDIARLMAAGPAGGEGCCGGDDCGQCLAAPDLFICPTTGEAESRTVGGFDVCCDHPRCPGNREEWKT